MGLAGMGVPDHSHMPRADVLLFEHLVETQRAVSFAAGARDAKFSLQ